ncbi:hypothetical protein LEP1GSC191_1534 [Leptospira borgpetersenii serovar Mini str. 201000851]|uniref:Uncharacterized protein n=2 Tax=Leptospira borgpetersenii TaxID=174 RepID=M3F7B6_LEPBO|nr:hypothetical protein LEP1GSC128_1354 [Leptospira borgpetersenii str. 200801926]EMF97852.1 hypothetical protein LEP1GSC123_4094 [Leptospira borgpetersenii str. 200701203]ENO64966.1 hypothetical protein LEP1GSC191_1534 [Leptospira borgpetersenii serovar Mini str. 201000851]
MKEVELKKKLESITFQVTLGVVQKIREGDLEFVSHLPGLFSLLVGIGNRGRIEKGCNPAETVVVYLLGP